MNLKISSFYVPTIPKRKSIKEMIDLGIAPRNIWKMIKKSLKESSEFLLKRIF